MSEDSGGEPRSREEERTDLLQRRTQILQNRELLRSQLLDTSVRLRAQRPWFRNLNLWLGVAGIVITILVALIIFYISRDIRQLSIGYSGPVAWLTSEESGLTLSYEASEQQDESIGWPVETLWRLLITIQNTGSEGISGDMFPDGPIEFKLTASGVNGSSLESIPLVLRVADISEKRQRQAQLVLMDNGNPVVFTYKPSLMNEGQIANLEVLLSRMEGVDLKVDGAILDGRISFVGQKTIKRGWVAVRRENFRTLIQGLGGRTVDASILGFLFLGSVVSLILLLRYYSPLAVRTEFLSVGAYVFLSVGTLALLVVVLVV